MPMFQPYIHPDNDPGTFHAGLTKREYFSVLALQGLMANPNTCPDDIDMITEDAVAIADSLIKELNKESPR